MTSTPAKTEVKLPDQSSLLDRLLAAYGALPERPDGPLSTEPVKRVLKALGHPERRLAPVIHVAGTNGKGSTVAFIRGVAEAHGLRVHVDTSPHLIRVNERIRIAGDLIEDQALEELTEKVLKANDGAPLSFYEGMTAVAIEAFAATPADLVILEVGLGGRFDSTNVVDAPAVSTITPIDFDHMKFLGDRIEQIAWEKAGIIKAGCPVVSAPQREAALGVLQDEATSVSAPFYQLGETHVSGTSDAFSFHSESVSVENVHLGLEGPHQIYNAGLALLALEKSGQIKLDPDRVRRGLSEASWPARMQLLSEGPLQDLVPDQVLWLDGGHNPHAARAIVKKFQEKGPLTIICGLIAGKDLANFLGPLSELLPDLIAIPLPEPLNGHDPKDIQQAATKLGMDAPVAGDIRSALLRAKETRKPNILICGSLYLAGHVLEENGYVIT